MILLVHLLFGAAIGSAVKNVSLGLLLAYLSHYLLDIIPHVDYPIKNIKEKQWRRALPDFLKILLDLSVALLLLLIFSTNEPIVYIYGFVALIPDGLTFLGYLFPNKALEVHYSFHQKLHFLKKVKISEVPIHGSWRFISQTLIVIASLILLKF